MPEDKTQADIEWENRTLCSDESCIGAIGPDGRCKECGKAFEGYVEPSPLSGDATAPAEVEIKEAPLETEEADREEDSDWENRTLCSDESCIGVIGPDGCCKECGKPLEG